MEVVKKTATKKKETFRERLKKQFMILCMRNKYFIGDYHTNEKEIRRFVVEGEIVLLDVNRGTDRIHEFDFRLRSTKANKKDREVIVTYVKDPAWIKWTLVILNVLVGVPAVSNRFMKAIGFRDNRVERTRLGV